MLAREIKFRLIILYESQSALSWSKILNNQTCAWEHLSITMVPFFNIEEAQYPFASRWQPQIAA